MPGVTTAINAETPIGKQQQAQTGKIQKKATAGNLITFIARTYTSDYIYILNVYSGIGVDKHKSSLRLARERPVYVLKCYWIRSAAQI